MIYKTTSSKEIINRLFRDFPGFNSNRISDCIEWMGDALEEIGYINLTIKKVECIDVLNYKGHLPCDLYKINQMYYNGRPITQGNGNFTYGNYNNITKRVFINEVPKEQLYADYSATVQENIKRLLDEISYYSTKASNYNYTTYMIESNCLKTQFEEGKVYIDYEAYNTDSEGFPAIPDYVEHRNALQYYCTMKIMESGVKHPVFTFKDVYELYNKYARQASVKQIMPDRAGMESFIRGWKRLIPLNNSESQLYENLNYDEIIDAAK